MNQEEVYNIRTVVQSISEYGSNKSGNVLVHFGNVMKPHSAPLFNKKYPWKITLTTYIYISFGVPTVVTSGI
jgi:hypothetical protein